jgi:hypothetical protein
MKCVQANVSLHGGKIQKPLQTGGIGIPNSKQMGIALPLRWLWLPRTDPECFWTGLPIVDDPVSTALFKASTRIVVDNGASLIFWTDDWLAGKCIEEIAPDLFQAVSRHARARHSVASTLQNQAWIRDISGALTIPVLIQYLNLKERLQHGAQPHHCILLRLALGSLWCLHL